MKISELNSGLINSIVSVTGIIKERKNKTIKDNSKIIEKLIIRLKDEITKDEVKVEIPLEIVDAKIVRNGNLIDVQGDYLEDRTLRNGEMKFKIYAHNISIVRESSEEDLTLKHKEFRAPKRKKAEMVKDYLQSLMNYNKIEEKEIREKIYSKFEEITKGELDDIFEILNREGIFTRPQKGYIKIS